MSTCGKQVSGNGKRLPNQRVRGKKGGIYSRRLFYAGSRNAISPAAVRLAEGRREEAER